MIVRKLVAELQAGDMKVEVDLQGASGAHVVRRLVERLSDTLDQRRLGTEFEGPIRQAEDDSSASAHFPENWQPEDAEILMRRLSGLCNVLSGDMPFAPAAEVDDEGSDSIILETTEIEERSEKLDFGPLPDVDREGWISQLKNSQSRLGELLKKHDIGSDEQYVEKEEKLSHQQRVDLADCRFRYGLSLSESGEAPGGFDLQVLALFFPPWIKRVPLTIKGFSNRGRNCFQKSNIHNVEDLARIPVEAMLQIPALGRETYRQIAEALQKNLIDYASGILLEASVSAEARRPQTKEAAADFSNFHRVWDAVLALIDGDDKKAILTRRIGAPASEPETLEAIGMDYGVTRERIRQHEARTIARLHQNPHFNHIRSSIEAELERQIQWLSGAIPLGDDSPVAALRGASPSALKRFFQMVLQSQYRVLVGSNADGIPSGRIVFGVSEEKLRAAINSVKSFTISHGDHRRSTFMPMVLSHIQESFHESIHGDLKEYVDNWINWDHSIDPRIISFGDSTQATVAAILDRSDRPMKIEEVQSIARDEFGLDKNKGYFNNVAGELCLQPASQTRNDVLVPIFLIGSSTYCTNRHLPIKLEDLAHLVSPLVSLVRDGRECLITDEPYQWHTMDLWKELNRMFPDNELSQMKPEMGWRAVDWLLRYHQPDGVINLLKARWVKDIPGVEQKERTQHEAIVYLLKNHFKDQRVPRKEFLKKFEHLQSNGAKGQLQIKPPVRYEDGEYWLEY